MKYIAEIIVSAWRRLEKQIYFQRTRRSPFDAEPALRSVLFNAEQMEIYGRELAEQHRVTTHAVRDHLLERLNDNEKVLRECCRMFTAVTALSKFDQRITPAGEWLLDNYYLIEEQIRTTRKHLPKGYSRELPQLAGGMRVGMPRVYDIALENISHGDGRLDMKILRRFVSAYQTVTPLRLGELWAIPIMLRLAVIENLRRVAVRVSAAWRDHMLAVRWSNRMVETAGRDRKGLVVVVADMALSEPPMTSSFVAEFARRLQGQHAALSLPLTWIEENLAETGQSVNDLVRSETQQQAADQVSISNSMASLRLLSAVDWREFVESLSAVESTLCKDPAGVYTQTDFATRDRCRHAVERLAKSNGHSESAVAELAVHLAEEAASRNPGGDVASVPSAYVGYYLIGRGVSALEASAVQQSDAAPEKWLRLRLRRFLRAASLPLYLSVIAAVALLLTRPFAAGFSHAGLHGVWWWLASLLALSAVSEPAVRLVNWLAMQVVRPSFIPRMDYSAGLPAEARTMVVIPALISTPEDVTELLEKLEVHYLGNRDPQLRFGLLTDFRDASEQTLPEDASLLEFAARGVKNLNRKYPEVSGSPFFLCHRPRCWNAGEQTWMGHERKRGKLCDFNGLLRGYGRDRFMLLVGDAVNRELTDEHSRAAYVITLDSDTQLPRGAARKLVGAMAHPLNRPQWDPYRKRVVAGYGILQPRIGINLPSAERSGYARLFCCGAGIDPYTRNVSDAYQDLFGEGSFIGKGIYDVDALGRAVQGRFPDNCILSHDLIEGCCARSGLISDVLLYESFPSCYSAEVSRRRRWIRGDWQLLPWLLPRVPLAGGGRGRNAFSALARWKMFDNLRRSLAPAALWGLLVTGWFTAPCPVLWSLGVAALVFGVPLFTSLTALFRKPADLSFTRNLRVVLRSLRTQLLCEALGLMWLPHEMFYSLDAALRTLWRVAISRRRLLQWTSSREAERSCAQTLEEFYRLMWICPVSAAAIGLLLIRDGSALLAALPFLSAWAVAPVAAWRLSRPSALKTFTPTVEQQRFLRVLARRTWAFFEHYVGEEDNWLPPDNMQERPTAVVAHRTSPTNMGLALLAHLAAADLGYLSAGRLLERVGNMLRSMSGLERYRNHFYNWYDTRTARPLPPRYISTVDSGNLAGHLLTLRPGLSALGDEPVFHKRLFDGLADTAQAVGSALLADGLDCRALFDFQTALDAARRRDYGETTQAAQSAKHLFDLALRLEECHPLPQSESDFWIRVLAEQCRDVQDDLYLFVLPGVAGVPTLRELAHLDVEALPEDRRQRGDEVRKTARQRLAAAEQLAETAAELARMDFSFLYDNRRDLLSIGLNLDDGRPDPAFYDLLASEARLAYYVGIALGQLPQESWFALGRLLTDVDGIPVLLSWSGSMFEYLMPLLVMPGYEGSLLEQTCRGAVTRQIEYGLSAAPAWGISESCYNMLDARLNYQYRAFGVPGLGLKPGLGEDLVLAPYASALALMVAPAEACANLQHLAARGASGRYGMYEAVDHTPSRLPRGHSSAVIRAFMSHHQGMSLLALVNLLMNNIMQRRFLSVPQFQATELLLQERVPRIAPEYMHASAGMIMNTADASARAAENKPRVFRDPDSPQPAVQLLSNGRYHVMVSSGGGGYSRWRDLAVTRWREDATRDNWGQFLYLRDVQSGVFWSATCWPVLRRPEHFEAVFSDARAEFRVREQDFDAHTEIAVSPEDDVELRRLRITNRGRLRRTVEFTSYAEVVLAPPAADDQHPAFSNLFVETELVPELQAVICTRRPRSADETGVWMCQLLAVHGADIDVISYETDRNRFIGRDRSPADPAAMDPSPDASGKLSGSSGAVLDPIVAIRCRVTLDPGRTATLDLVTGISEGREACLRQIEKFRDRRLADRVFDLAWTHSQVLLHQLNASLRDAGLYQQLASSILYANAALRAEPSVLSANMQSQQGLWGQSISGDLPIVLLKIGDTANIELAAQMVKAHTYWRHKGLIVDLVIWNEERVGYRQQLQDLILGMLPSAADSHLLDQPGGIFVRSGQKLSREDRILLQTAARVVISDTNGTLAEQVYRPRAEPALPRRLSTCRPQQEERSADASLAVPQDLQMANPYGGFSADGSEYVIVLPENKTVPAPWVNVLTNPEFGSIVSESGSAYSWRENAHEFRLTPWENDPVCDDCGEALFLRDEQSGRFWSPTLLPARGRGTYITRHGFGYSVFEHMEEGVYSELRVFVAPDLPVKFSVLRLGNRSDRSRHLSVTGYVAWVLGDLRAKSAMHVIVEPDSASGALLARNPYSMDFPGRTAFFGLSAEERTFTCDRREFLGRNGTLAAPAALQRVCLSGRNGPGLDPCSALQTAFRLEPGEEREFVFVLGAAQGAEAAADLARRCCSSEAAAQAFARNTAQWKTVLGAVQVETPDPSVDVLVNGWLVYQILSSRFWARSGFYQSGGAFGFRDQLQDAMALLHALPQVVREHLLTCAGHQFPEGDVLHWWHPPVDRGVRTRCSDDYLWLPLAVSRYVRITGDTGVLDEEVNYIRGRKPGLDEESVYDLPIRSELRESVYDHCVRAVNHGLTRGEHDLPLIGSGDWNDGMNKVGDKGRGESVWLGFFQYVVLREFAAVARLRNDMAFAELCEMWAAQRREAAERHGWDGEWFRRAYFDDGTPLGSALNEECRIDALVQSWAVLSGAASAERRAAGMAALEAQLTQPEAGLIRLLTPPFDHSALEPGYIKGYVPGVRENGGQYTHAAVWAVMAFAAQGEGEKAWELLRLINPVRHGDSAAAVEVYKVEPYVVSADVYAVSPHVGRGGWSWYTGASSWMYRLIVESLLGLRVQGDRLSVRPLLPVAWKGFLLRYRYGRTEYRIRIMRSADGVFETLLDGHKQDDGTIPLRDDGAGHEVRILWPGGPGNAEEHPLG